MTEVKIKTVKQPADHKPKKAEVVEESAVKAVEVRGVSYEVDTEALDDYEVLEALTVNNIVPALQMMLGTEQLGKVKDSLRNEKGRVKASDMAEFFADLAGALNPS